MIGNKMPGIQVRMLAAGKDPIKIDVGNVVELHGKKYLLTLAPLDRS